MIFEILTNQWKVIYSDYPSTCEDLLNSVKTCKPSPPFAPEAFTWQIHTQQIQSHFSLRPVALNSPYWINSIKNGDRSFHCPSWYCCSHHWTHNHLWSRQGISSEEKSFSHQPRVASIRPSDMLSLLISAGVSLCQLMGQWVTQ